MSLVLVLFYLCGTFKKDSNPIKVSISGNGNQDVHVDPTSHRWWTMDLLGNRSAAIVHFRGGVCFLK